LADRPLRAPAAQYRNGIPPREGARLARSIRDSVPNIPEDSNVAVAEAALDYKGRKLYAAVSGRDAPLLPSPKDGRWFHAGHSGAIWRGFDTEAKILENIATDLPVDATGTVNLYTELSPCFSCTSVIEQFRQRFPGIRVNVTWGTGEVSTFGSEINLLPK
jgi:The  BURPS668_1122 family of deaminases